MRAEGVEAPLLIRLLGRTRPDVRAAGSRRSRRARMSARSPDAPARARARRRAQRAPSRPCSSSVARPRRGCRRRSGRAGRPRRANARHGVCSARGHSATQSAQRDRRGEQAAGLQPVQRREIVAATADVEVLAADHAERRLRRALARPPAIGYESASRSASARSASPARIADRLAVPRPGARPAAPHLVVVERRQVVVDEREVVHELERGGRRQRGLRLGACCLGGREADHRPDALAAAARAWRIESSSPPSSGSERARRGTPRRARAARPAAHDRPRASPAGAPPRPPSRSLRARSGSRSPRRVLGLLEPRARALEPRAAPQRRAAPRRSLMQPPYDAPRLAAMPTSRRAGLVGAAVQAASSRTLHMRPSMPLTSLPASSEA